jgi:hypothetical protein
MTFRVQGSDHKFVKLANSNALDENTGKDAIFAPQDKCVAAGWKKGYYPLYNC